MSTSRGHLRTLLANRHLQHPLHKVLGLSPTYDRATIEARTDDIERNSDDPNASDFAELIRKTFLN